MNIHLEATPLENIRVIGIYAHIDAGKTTTSEAILYHTGRIHRAGSVDEGNTQLDWMEQERARGITITAAATSCVWRGRRINLIDTPGHIDFTAEVMRSIRVIDGAVMVLCAAGGVETQTETVWRYADGHGPAWHTLPGGGQKRLPRLIFINKMDRDSADFEWVLSEIHAQFTPHAVALQLPLGYGEDFNGMIDLLEGQALVWNAGSEDPVGEEIPARLRRQAGEMRTALIDAICETDEVLLARRLNDEAIPLADLHAALRRATIAGALVPVLCGSSKRRIGIQPLLDAITGYLPAPGDLPAVRGVSAGADADLPEGRGVQIERGVRVERDVRVERGVQIERDVRVEREASLDAPFCSSAFKIVSDPHVGHLTWVRVFSGVLKVGEEVYNPRTGKTERVGRIYRMHGNRREHATSLRAGDVMALVGIDSAITGDTLCHPKHPIALESFQFPEPVISVALTPPPDEERDRMHQSLGRLCAEDPTLRLSFDGETGEQLLSGMGELHLEVTVDRLRSEYGIQTMASPPQVAYRETVRSRAEATGSYRKQTGGHGHFAVARVRVEPLPGDGRGDDAEMKVQFRSVTNPLEMPIQYVRAIEAGVREALEKGAIAGYPTTGVLVTLLGGRYHEIDSDSSDFRIAGSLAARQAMQLAEPALLEPVMRADILVHEDYLRKVMGDFLSRRGNVLELQIRGTMRALLGEVPLSGMRGYASVVRDLTQGRGSFTLEFRRYQLVPEETAQNIIAERQEAGKINRR